MSLLQKWQAAVDCCRGLTLPLVESTALYSRSGLTEQILPPLAFPGGASELELLKDGYLSPWTLTAGFLLALLGKADALFESLNHQVLQVD